MLSSFLKNNKNRYGLFCVAKQSRGFTLVEMLIAVSLFIVVSTISIGSIITIFDSNKRAQSSKTVVDNFNLAFENMIRTIRFGKDYQCGGGVGDCSSGDTSITVDFKGDNITYRLNGNSIQKKENNGDYEDITSPETVIEHLKFYVFGTNKNDSNQPYVVVVIKGYSGNKSTNQSIFSIQTMISQRALDV